MSSLKFGTSGLRGLAADLDAAPAYAYTRAFLAALIQQGRLSQPRSEVLVARDLRPSSASIAARCMAAIAGAGFVARDCGEAPTPALALSALAMGAPSIMVTGSHIPLDRNGLKFYRADGEIEKADEAAIAAALAALPQALRSSDARADGVPLDVLEPYRQRAVDFFGPGSLGGLRLGVYQHSSVARQVMPEILRALGAEVVLLGWSETFLPVDTEAVRAEDIALAKDWADGGHLDAIVSTDGDADRPLIADERGVFLRGDAVGALTAALLKAGTVVTPVTSNSKIETLGAFGRLIRTRVGSPYVLAGMAGALAAGGGPVIGFEANGGVLLGSDVVRDGRRLTALPTRDAVLPICAILTECAARQVPLSRLRAELGFAAATSGLIRQTVAERSAEFMTLLEDRAAAQRLLAPLGSIASVSAIDGMRFALTDGRIIHFRPSNNAPELRIYAEAANETEAMETLAFGQELAAPLVTC